MRKVFLEGINSIEDFRKNIGRKIHFVYDDIEDTFTIHDVYGYENVTIIYNNISFDTKIDRIKNCNLGHIINNIAASNPWMIPYFEDKNFPYNNTFATKNKTLMRCPYCGRTKKTKPYYTYKTHHLPCVCLDNMSYPEKLFYCLLEDLGIDFEYQFCPKWKEFIFKGKKRTARYDFLLPNHLIVETDGAWHNEDNMLSGQTKEESIMIDKLKDEIAKNNGYSVIHINCYNSDFNYIKKEIINTLSNILNLENVNWDKIESNSYSNLLKTICNYKKENPEATTTKIGEKFHFSPTTIIKYLKIGTKLGWCLYNPSYETYMSGKRMKGVVHLSTRKDAILAVDINNGEILKRYDCLEDADRDGFDGGNIAKCCKREYNFSYGFIWFYENDYSKEKAILIIENMRRNGWQRGVKQYDLDGNLIKEYISIMDAERETGIPNSSISNACRRKREQVRAGNYMWRYSDEGGDKISPYIFPKKKPIYKIDLNGNIIKKYNSITEASIDNNIPLGCIARVCRGERKTAGGYIWKYADEVDNIKSA